MTMPGSCLQFPELQWLEGYCCVECSRSIHHMSSRPLLLLWVSHDDAGGLGFCLRLPLLLPSSPSPLSQLALRRRCGLDSNQRMVVRQGKLIEACINASFGSHGLRPVGGRRHRPRYAASARSGDVVRSFGSYCCGMGSDAEAAAVALTASTIAMQGVGTQEEDNKEAGVTGDDFVGVFREATDERSCALTRKAW
ncbi:uncharacterized protein G2W53_038962 [Senna tora]|uniref:Uncharacterized protein n=1 Tax=Senna tora TaxID=362788 RepID=A0A834SP77_9FABA|nr:uncharacterized protein G2W53_038962 [Senna tora]